MAEMERTIKEQKSQISKLELRSFFPTLLRPLYRPTNPFYPQRSKSSLSVPPTPPPPSSRRRRLL